MSIVVRLECSNTEELGQQLADLADLFRDTLPAVAEEMEKTDDPPTEPAKAPIGEQVPVTHSELDADSQPWNEEIHSSKKTKKTSGQWTLKRGANKARVAEIYAAHSAAEQLALPAAGTISPAAAAAATTTAIDPFAPPVGATADPIAECIRIATAILAAAPDDVQRAQFSQRMNEVMAASNLVGLAQLIANPDVAPTVLVGLQQLAGECGITC